jgi:hypothetical protein
MFTDLLPRSDDRFMRIIFKDMSLHVKLGTFYFPVSRYIYSCIIAHTHTISNDRDGYISYNLTIIDNSVNLCPILIIQTPK